MRYTVAIVERRLTDYRIPLFELMRQCLVSEGVALRLLHGDPMPNEVTKNDSGLLAWAEYLPTRYVAGGRICWQPFMHRVGGCDLVVVSQENKLVNNLSPLLNPWRRQALAFWGHGRNMQASRPDHWLERAKRWTTPRVDWWFAYTEISAGLVRDVGFNPARITVLNNSIDTATLREAVALARRQPKAELRAQFGLPEIGPVGVYIGSLYAEKRIDLLIDAARAVHRRVPEFSLLIAGDGPDRAKVEVHAAESPFIKYVGRVHGARKADLLVIGDLLLNPGLVGLGILDAFIAGIPLLTTDCHIHSPEITYLEPGHNGVMTAETTADFSAAVLQVLEQPDTMARLRAGSAASAEKYSIENMAERFCKGIEACLAMRA